MSLIQTLTAWISGPKVPAEVPANENHLFYQRQAAMRKSQVESAQEFERLLEEVKGLAGQYGSFETFLFRPDFDLFLRREVLPSQQPANPYPDFLATNHWEQKHPFNFPGPFYTGESDTCGTGAYGAPRNVGHDAYSCEYVFRQPASYEELAAVLSAAAVEVFDSYAANGNEHWTYEACKAWWRTREQLVQALQDPEVVRKNHGQDQLYLAYLRGPAELDLRRYCYFLENGVYPTTLSVALPEL